MDWIGLDVSQTVTPPRAPGGANKFNSIFAIAKSRINKMKAIIAQSHGLIYILPFTILCLISMIQPMMGVLFHFLPLHRKY